MLQNKDSLQNTIVVATVLCLACAALVSAAAVGLRPIKNANILLDKRTNVLKVCGFTADDIKEAGGINELFNQRFTTIIIDLETGELAEEACQKATEEAGKNFPNIIEDYDQIWCSKSKDKAVSDQVLPKKEDICGIKYREKFSHVFVLKSDSGQVEKYVFPVRSYGLWSMMQGYLAVEPDFQTVAGLTFYEQAETPGLGGEIMNPVWKAKWPGKKIFEGENVALEVSKTAKEGDPYSVDALSGATITSNGVSALVEYWMGDKGFGPFIEQQKANGGAIPASTDKESASLEPATSGVNHG